MARIPTLGRKLSTTIPFARGVADRAVSTAGPMVVGVVGRVTARLPRRSRTEPSHPETFTPSPVADHTQAHEGESNEPPAKTSGPSPSAVARNVSGPRPTAKPATKAKPRSVPGARPR